MAFTSTYCPDTAKQLNEGYEKEVKLWQQKEDCIFEKSKTTDIKKRIQEFSKCKEKYLKESVFSSSSSSKPTPEGYFTKLYPPPEYSSHINSSYEEWNKIKDKNKHLGIIDAYYLANENYIGDGRAKKLCGQNGILKKYKDIKDCINYTYWNL